MFATRPRRSFAARVVGAAILLAAGVSISTAAAPLRAGDEHLVEIVGFTYVPAELTIAVGDTVTWTNLDAIAHTATSTSGAFDSGDLAQGESFSLTFTAAGTYDYLCTPHPTMTGRIVVQPAAAAPTPAPSPADSAGPTPAAGGSLPDVRMSEPRAEWMTPAGLGLLAGAALIAVGGSARRAVARRRRP